MNVALRAIVALSMLWTASAGMCHKYCDLGPGNCIAVSTTNTGGHVLFTNNIDQLSECETISGSDANGCIELNAAGGVFGTGSSYRSCLYTGYGDNCVNLKARLEALSGVTVSSCDSNVIHYTGTPTAAPAFSLTPTTAPSLWTLSCKLPSSFADGVIGSGDAGFPFGLETNGEGCVAGAYVEPGKYCTVKCHHDYVSKGGTTKYKCGFEDNELTDATLLCEHLMELRCHLPPTFGTGIEPAWVNGCPSGIGSSALGGQYLPFSERCYVQCGEGYTYLSGDKEYSCRNGPTMVSASLKCRPTVRSKSCSMPYNLGLGRHLVAGTGNPDTACVAGGMLENAVSCDVECRAGFTPVGQATAVLASSDAADDYLGTDLTRPGTFQFTCGLTLIPPTGVCRAKDVLDEDVILGQMFELKLLGMAQDWLDSQTLIMRDFFASNMIPDIAVPTNLITIQYSAGTKTIAVSNEKSIQLNLVVLAVTVLGTYNVETIINYVSKLESAQLEHPLEATHPIESARYQSPLFQHEAKHCQLPSEFGEGIETTRHGGCTAGATLPFAKYCNVQCKDGYEAYSGYSTYGCYQTMNSADLVCKVPTPVVVISAEETKTLCAPTGTKEFCY